ncbi:unnamed protein product [Prorocentrum cordatum]|uniref:EngB-type G domain-containing protein n=1 Tax=Prorocentrum cordatum TaxID=2364126 RepID=A0ABN9T6U3_9DINO|nr:unnamed protein product [Polarella glacialis]
MVWNYVGVAPAPPLLMAAGPLGEGLATVGTPAEGRAQRVVHAARLCRSAPPARARLQAAGGDLALGCAWAAVTGTVLGTVSRRRRRGSRGCVFGGPVSMMAGKKKNWTHIAKMEVEPMTYDERIKRSKEKYKHEDQMAAREERARLREEALKSRDAGGEPTGVPWTNIPARRKPKSRVSYWVDPEDIKRGVPLADGAASVWHVSDACEAQKASVGWSASIDGASQPRRRLRRARQQPRPEAAAAAPGGEGAPAQAAEAGEGAGRAVDWESPGMDLLERARLAAEEGWEERLWQSGYGGHAVDYVAMVPEVYKGRVRDAHPKEAVKRHIEALRLGKRTKRRLPKGPNGQAIQRPKHFSGSDPVHNGLIDSIDNGKTSPLGEMAVRLSKGYLRLQAEAYMNGVKGQHGVFPVAMRPEVAFIGASNAGKSSLMNAITRTQKLADTGDLPGVTRSMKWYRPSELPIDIIDMPGFGYARGAEFQSTVIDFIATRKSLRLVYFLVDARSGLRPPDWRFLAHLGAEGPQRAFIMTKCDMLPPGDLAKAATVALQDLKSVPKASPRLLMVSSREGNGMHDLRMDLCSRVVAWSKRVQEVQRSIDAQEGNIPPQGAQAGRGKLRHSSMREDISSVGTISKLEKVDLLAPARNLPERL